MSAGFRPIRRIAALAILAFGMAAPAEAQTTIKVLVNGEPITSYDIAQRDRLLAVFGQKAGPQKATEALIDEAIQRQEAQRRGLRAQDAQVEAAYAAIAQGVKWSPAQLTEYLAQQGVNAASVKAMRRAQITWQMLVDQQMRRSSSVKQSEVAELLAKTKPEQNVVREFMLQPIVFVVPKGSSSDFTAQRRREAENFRRRFESCEKSVEQAKSLRGVVVQPLLRRDTAALAGPQGAALAKMKVGETTAPEPVDIGIQIIAVCSARDIQSTAAARAEIENKLARELFAELAPEFMKELRSKAIIQHR